jgi:hypothetical protein
MFLPGSLFDLAVFGGVLLALLLDNTFSPLLHGALSLIVVGAFTYAAAQEFCAASERRGLWAHESLATSLSVTLVLFFYYFGRNSSDLSLLVMSVGTMMVSLMAIIALIGAFSAAMSKRSAKPFFGLFVTLFASLLLGALASMLLLAMTADASSPPLLRALTLSWQASPLLKMLVPILGFVVWKAREKASPPRENAQPTVRESAASTRAPESYGEHSEPQAVLLSTRRGLLLDRFLPILLLGALCFFMMKSRSAPTETPANAATTNTAATSGSIAR